MSASQCWDLTGRRGRPVYSPQHSTSHSDADGLNMELFSEDEDNNSPLVPRRDSSSTMTIYPLDYKYSLGEFIIQAHWSSFLSVKMLDIYSFHAVY